MAARKLDAVLPLRLHDYERFTILDRSLRLNFRDLGRCWVVTTDAEHAELRRMVDSEMYRVVPESWLVPELSAYRPLYRLLYRTPVGMLLGKRYNTAGWFVQQLVKLAIAEKIETDFYLTLDADVICMKPVGHDDLVENSRAITHIHPGDVHPDWYADAERVLGMARSGVTHGVTPSVLSRDGVLQLHEFLATRVSRTPSALGALCPRGSRLRDLFCGWRSHLLRNTPWTEYSLYYTFLESTRTFDWYHVRRGREAIYDSDRSVWFKRDLAEVNIEEFMRGEGFFLVIQSNTGIPAEEIWDKVRAYLE